MGNDPLNSTDPDGKRNKPCDANCHRRVQDSRRNVQRRQTAAESGARKEKAASEKVGSQVVGQVANSQGVLAGAAETTGAKGAGVKALKKFGAAGNVIAGGIDAKSKIDGGKNVGSSVANASGSTATSVASGALTGAGVGALGGNPLTVAIGAVAGSVLADVSGLSDAGGDLAESAYNGAAAKPVCKNLNAMTGGCF